MPRNAPELEAGGPPSSQSKTLIEQMEDLSVEEFYVEVALDASAGEDAVRVIAISPKPKK